VALLQAPVTATIGAPQPLCAVAFRLWSVTRVFTAEADALLVAVRTRKPRRWMQRNCGYMSESGCAFITPS